MTAFSIQNLTVVKGGKKILDSVSFDVQEGEFVCIVGPSGAGKSTLLRQLNRLDYGRTGGQILAGVSPLLAVRYQLLIFFCIAASAALVSWLSIRMVRSLFFTRDDQFIRLESLQN